MSMVNAIMAARWPSLEGRMKTEHDLQIEFLKMTNGLPAGSRIQRSRSDLERIFAQGGFFDEMKAPLTHSDGRTEVAIIRPYLISEKLCPPACKAPLESLRPIFLNQLVVDTVERGSVIVVRSFTNPNSDRYLCTAVEDTQGGVDCLILHCRDPLLTAEETLPNGVVLAIKEPYYVTFPDLQHGIQVDHPSDLIELDISSDLYPAQWKDEVLDRYPQGASQLKVEGNRAVGNREFMRATRLYNMAAYLCTPAEDVLRHDVMRNRALTNLSLGRFPQALADAIAAVDPPTEDTNEENPLLQYKAQCRAASALYGLGRFEEAARYFTDACKLPLSHPTDAASSGLKRATNRMKEEKNGEYDFQTIFNLVQLSKPLTDTANFLRNTRVVDFGPPRGRGLVATRDIAMGELVMCEKAFVTSLQDGCSAPFVDANWPNIHGKTTTGAMARLPMMLMHKMGRADSADEPVFRLCSGPRKLSSGWLIDGKPVVDSLAAHSAVQLNAFASESLCSSEVQCGFLGQVSPWSLQDFVDKTLKGGFIRQCGIWPHASMINHACDANSTYSFMGDLMIIRAAKDIQKGDDITIVYNRRVDADPRKLQETLKLNYGFRCQCAACKAHNQCPDQKLDERRDRFQEFFKDYSTLLMASIMPPKELKDATTGASADHTFLAKFEKHREVIETTYPQAVYGDSIPRAELSPIAFCCAKVCHDQITGRPDLLLKWALLCLRDSGLKLSIDETQDKLTWDAAAAVRVDHSVEAALYGCIAYDRLNKRMLAKQFRELAQLYWVIYTGASVGFKERFPYDDVWKC